MTETTKTYREDLPPLPAPAQAQVVAPQYVTMPMIARQPGFFSMSIGRMGSYFATYGQTSYVMPQPVLQQSVPLVTMHVQQQMPMMAVQPAYFATPPVTTTVVAPQPTQVVTTAPQPVGIASPQCSPRNFLNGVLPWNWR